MHVKMSDYVSEINLTDVEVVAVTIIAVLALFMNYLCTPRSAYLTRNAPAKFPLY